jgi:hypothetical protein
VAQAVEYVLHGGRRGFCDFTDMCHVVLKHLISAICCFRTP